MRQARPHRLRVYCPVLGESRTVPWKALCAVKAYKCPPPLKSKCGVWVEREREDGKVASHTGYESRNGRPCSGDNRRRLEQLRQLEGAAGGLERYQDFRVQ